MLLLFIYYELVLSGANQREIMDLTKSDQSCAYKPSRDKIPIYDSFSRSSILLTHP